MGDFRYPGDSPRDYRKTTKGKALPRRSRANRMAETREEASRPQRREHRLNQEQRQDQKRLLVPHPCTSAFSFTWYFL
jgi:hypothetical protein